jgi:hypothetical protein
MDGCFSFAALRLDIGRSIASYTVDHFPCIKVRYRLMLVCSNKNSAFLLSPKKFWELHKFSPFWYSCQLISASEGSFLALPQ